MDHDRPLAARGQQASRLIGQFLATTNYVPDQILTSTATRALQTATLAKENGNWPSTVAETRRLYGAEPGSLLTLIQNADDTLVTLMLVGHNPTLEVFGGLLMGGRSLRMPTCALACFMLQVDAWNEVNFGSANLSWLVTPKLLANAI